MKPLKMLVLTLALLAVSAAAQTLYFYPPDDAKWIAGRAYISQGSAATAAVLELDATAGRCGWYKVSIPSSSPLRNAAQFWLGKPGKDRIGPNGRWSVDFEPTDDFNEVGGVFRLADIFTRLGSNNIYFVADELDPANSNAGWYGTDPGNDDPSRCEFNLAAFIYDTDPSVHPDFSCGSWVNGLDEGNGANTKGTCEEGPPAYNGAKGNLKPECTGVVKGLVKSTLNAQTRKIECDNCTKKGCWTSADLFKKAFEFTPGTNVERCYNMPFTQIKSGAGAGSFEFDSDKMLNAGGRAIGGFFPTLLDTRGDGDYSQCSTCDTKRSADRFPPRVKALTKEIFDAYQSKEGDFKDGDTPKLGAFVLTPAGDPIYDWVARSEANSTNPNWSAWYLHGSTALKNTYGPDKTGFDANAKANQHFCFESHADFYYDPSQEFYFSGDDDIWVYINNKLVIDLGGTHMSAPGSIALRTLGLTEGEFYPIDIFFCDRRTIQSNVRISANMYVMQKSNFSNDFQRLNNTMCADIQSGNDCASKMGVEGASGKWCGNELIANGFKVEFYMVRRGNSKDTAFLSPIKNPDNCSGTNINDFQCYDGIKVLNAVYSCGGRGQCKDNSEAIKQVNLAGNFNVYARLLNSSGIVQGKPLLIDGFGSEASPIIIDSDGFYMVNRNNIQDTIWLSPAKNPDNCSGTSSNNFVCYGGIKVIDAVYNCGGFGECNGNAVATARVNITGNFDVYARLMQDGLLGELRLIDNINSNISPILPRFLSARVTARAKGNAIQLENLPKNAKIEVFNLQGKQIYSTTSGNSQILKILVQAKGVYMVKVSLGGEKIVLKVPLASSY